MVLEKPKIISGVVRDPDGIPVADALISFTNSPLPMPDIAALSDNNGKFTLAVSVAGTYDIQFNASGFAPKTKTVEIADDHEKNLDVRLEK